MFKEILLSVVLSTLVLNVFAASDVLEYGDATFDSKIQTHDIALVKFYAPWW